MKKIGSLLKFVFSNFGPLLVFYFSNQLFGLYIAVLASVVWTLGEALSFWIRKKPVTPFFVFTASTTLVFGLVDLYLQRSFLFKYEGALTNIFVGVFFGASLFGKKPIIQQFAEAQDRVSGDVSADGVFYFQFLTVAWSVYSFAKAGFYFWVASSYSLEGGLLIRTLFGSATFYALLLISIFGVKPICFILRKLGWLPSCRVQTTHS